MRYILMFFTVIISIVSNAQGFTIKQNYDRFEIHEILSQYIQKESISGNEKEAGTWLKELCEQNGLFVTQMGNENGNYNFSASIRPLSSNLPNIIFLNHIDVVPVGDLSLWRYPPFSGKIVDGEIWGRGAFDNKGAAIIQLASVIQAARSFEKSNIPYNVTFLAVSCEESQCAGGVKYVVDNYLDLLNPAVVIGEGPPGLKGIIEADTSLSLFGISIAHKRAFWLELKLAVSTSGHGSTTPLSYSNKDMIMALNNVVTEEQPAIFTDVNTQLLKDLGKLENGVKAFALKHPHTYKSVLIPKLRDRPEVYSLLSNTITLTSISSSSNIVNLIPGKTTALLDCRLLPEADRNVFLADLKKRLKNDSITIKVLNEMPPMLPSSDTTKFYSSLDRAIMENYPEAEVIPVMMPNFNDVGIFRSKGVTCYSSFPIQLDLDHMKHIHNYNESISVEPLLKGKQTYDAFIRDLVK
jgi:carboxypeptidase PM20D1